MIILALDCATKTGFCLMKDGKIIESGMQDFTKRRGESNGMLFIKFRAWLVPLVCQIRRLYVDHQTNSNEPIILAYESAHHRGGAATEICVGLVTRVLEIAAEYGAETMPVHTATLKKFATGNGRASKEDMVKKAAEVLGRQPIDDNEADAVLIAKFASREV